MRKRPRGPAKLPRVNRHCVKPCSSFGVVFVSLQKRCSIRLTMHFHFHFHLTFLHIKHHTLSATPLLSYPCCACTPRHRLLTWSPRENLLSSRSIAVSAVLRNLCRLRVSRTRRQPRRVSRATHHRGRFHVLRHHHVLTSPLVH
jgi:hypothetical protein